MEKLIEMSQKNIIECDHCDFVIPNTDPEKPEDGNQYINTGCPKCGNNLLTMKDYLDDKKVQKIVGWLNRWFSWITIFYTDKKRETITAKSHNGVSIEKHSTK